MLANEAFKEIVFDGSCQVCKAGDEDCRDSKDGKDCYVVYRIGKWLHC